MYDLNHLAFAYGKPSATGLFKDSSEDFRVDEILGFEPSGEGEHLFLHIEKKGLNTEELVKSVARLLEKSVKQISYAGLKDKNAITTQWLSIHCPGEEIPNANELQGPGWRVLQSQRNLRKLRIGALTGNRFKLIIREISDPSQVEARLLLIKQHGVPNYFGAQRFGYQGQNLIKAEEMLFKKKRIKDRFLKGLYYSTARSFLFNRILDVRVTHQNWNVALLGDVMQLNGTHSIFPYHVADETIPQRIVARDISPASVLWGRGKDLVILDALAFQQRGLQGFEPWGEMLEEQGVERAYRANVLHVNDLAWEWQDHMLTMHFTLPAGAYATSVLRELIV